MNNEKMGQFISELRKQRQMTQKELAEKLNVSDKAVSKWERGLSYPDISLLSPLSNILGVTTTELLNGEKNGAETTNVEVSIVNALEYSEKTAKGRIRLTQSIWSAIFSILILIAIFVVSIVNVAISGTFTWSLIPISASIFAWLVLFPTIKFGLKGIVGSLISFTLFIMPFLYVLDKAVFRIIGYDTLLFPLGIRIAPLSMIFFWIAFFLLKRFKTRRLFTIAFLVLLTSPLNFIVNSMVSEMLNQPLYRTQTILNAIATVIFAIIIFIIGLVVQQRTR